jgi:hypothetical protein
MNGNLLALAVREVAEAKDILQSLIVSSESFDYPKAKLALKTLQQKVRTLERLQTGLEAELPPLPKNIPNLCVVNFGAPVKKSTGST